MAGLRIPDIPALAGSEVADDDRLLVFDTSEDQTKSVSFGDFFLPVSLKANASAVGISPSAENMGTFTGDTIPDNVSAKAALQALEDNVDILIAGGGGGGGDTIIVDVPTGAVMTFAQGTPPTGWLLCDGAGVSRTTYANLFAAIGGTYGAGDGSTTFNLPDLRGEFVRGLDVGRGVDAGRTLGSAQTGAFASHTHAAFATGTATVSDPGHAHQQMRDDNFGAQATSGGNPDGNWGTLAIGLTGSATTGITVGLSLSVSNTSTGGTETRPRNVALLYCIKT